MYKQTMLKPHTKAELYPTACRTCPENQPSIYNKQPRKPACWMLDLQEARLLPADTTQEAEQ